MASELNLDYVRFVRQASNGFARTKYSYKGMQEDLFSFLKTAQWKQASCPNKQVTTVANKVTETDGKKSEEGEVEQLPTYTVYLQDRFDAFKQGGDADTTTATMCGYAGMVAYRYRLPQGYSSDIQQVSLKFNASRYLRSGLRVAIQLSNSPTPSDDWSVIRGEGTGAIVSQHTDVSDVEGVKSWGFMNQQDGWLLQTKAREEDLVFKSTSFPSLGTHTRYSYMWVYISIEDYTDYWTLYNADEPRYYSIEGSAQLVGTSTLVTFAGDVTSTVDWHETYAFGAQGTVDLNTDTEYEHRGESDYLNAYGTVAVEPAHAAYLAVPTPFVEPVFNIEKFPRRNRSINHVGAPDFRDATDTEAHGNIHINDVGVFQAVRSKWTYDTSRQIWSGVFGNQYHIRLHYYTSSNQSTPSSVKQSGFVQKGSAVMYESKAVLAPTGKEKYNKAKLNISYLTTPSDVVVGVNIWRSSSPDILGIYTHAMVGALLSYQDMYLEGKKTVTANETLNGTLNNGQTLTATADYIGFIPIPSGLTQTTLEIESELLSEVKPGELLIACPRVVSMNMDSNRQFEIDLDGYISLT